MRRSDGERFLVFDCGPLGDGGHGHYDALSIEMASGRPLVVDPGRFTYCDDPPHWRRWFKSTAAHNTVTVDGLDQTPYHRGKPKGGMARACLAAAADRARSRRPVRRGDEPGVRSDPPAAHPVRRRRVLDRPRRARRIATASVRPAISPGAEAPADRVTRDGTRVLARLGSACSSRRPGRSRSRTGGCRRATA